MFKKKSLFFYKISLIAIATLVFIQIAIVSFVLLKMDYIKEQVTIELSSLLKSTVSIDKFDFKISLSGVELHSTNIQLNKTDSIKDIYLDINIISSILQTKLDLSDVKVKDINFDFSKNANSQSTVIDLSFINDWLVFDNIELSNIHIKTTKTYSFATITITNNDGVLILKTNKTILPLPKIFSQDLPELDIIATADIENSTFKLEFTNEDIQLLAKAKILNGVSKSLDLSINIIRFSLSKTPMYLPNKIMDSNLLYWFNNAFEDGLTKNAKISFITTKSSTWAEAFKKTHIVANIPLFNTELLFNPDWQTLKKINGVVEITDNNLIVKADVELDKLKLKKVWANIPDLVADYPKVLVSGTFKINSSDAVSFIHSNKVIESEVGQFMSILNTQGDVETKLYMSIPFGEYDKTLINTDLVASFTNNTITIKNTHIPITNTNGTLVYKNYNLTASGIANITKYPVTWDLQKNINKPLILNVLAPTTTLKFVNTDGIWKVDFNNPDIYGNLVFTNDFISTPWAVYINRLNLDAFINNDNSNTNSSIDIEPVDIFPAIINIENLIYKGKNIAKVRLNISKYANSIVAINTTISDEKIKLSIDAKWHKEVTTAQITLQSHQLSDVLNRLSINNNIKNGKLKLVTDLRCDCDIFKMKLKDIEGKVNIDIGDGAILGQGFVFGNLLSLLNLKAIGGRLGIDLLDVGNDNFEYDYIRGDLTLKDGILFTQKFELTSPSSFMSFKGSTNLIKKQYNYEVDVNPSISTSLPLVAFLSGAGLAGLGIWVFDELFFDGQGLNSTVNFKYKITGPWNKPIIE